MTLKFLLSNFFASQDTPIVNDRKLLSAILYRTEERLTTVSFLVDILKTIKLLNVNKAHDDISVRLLKFCDAEEMRLLLLIFKNCIQYGVLPNLWKKSNIVPIHKDEGKQCMVNYHPV